ncbi:sodium:alanine symporter [Candidatus Dependentiae bacterium Noda2021]|nr:sodium:alanine symporter [Candidatus Dependentiae bacterium Noda2021]
MDMAGIFTKLSDVVLGWPLIIYVISIGIACTVALRFLQIRYFAKAWQWTLRPEKKEVNAAADMSPLQAFINALNIGIGNGSLAGMATAVYSGGPGAALWVVIISILLMAVRYAEVFLASYFAAHSLEKSTIGGPMLYLRAVPGGSYLAYAYALLCALFGFAMAAIMQSNSIRLAVERTFNVSPYVIATIFMLFVAYVVVGGAQRVVAISEKIVPIKVGVFFASSFVVLLYHYKNIIPALKLIINSGLSSQAILGGVAGYTVQQAMRFGMVRSINATETGLGTAAIFFGGTKSQTPVKDSIMTMLSTFVSMCVCFLVALCIVASGVWDNGLQSTALTSSAFETVFGNFGQWIVAFLSITFGIGVTVSYVYITRESWLTVTGGRFVQLFGVLYAVAAFVGALMNVDLVWMIADWINGGLLLINLFGIACLLPLIRSSFKAFEKLK